MHKIAMNSQSAKVSLGEFFQFFVGAGNRLTLEGGKKTRIGLS